MTLICIDDQSTLNLDTPIYKYLPTNAFFQLLQSRKLMFSRIDQWPDRFEGLNCQLIARLATLPEVPKTSVFGSCWTLQDDDQRLFDTDKEWADANKSLKGQGSVAMWESYCKNGGVRIQTTPRKILEVLGDSSTEIYHGQVCYVANEEWAVRKSVGSFVDSKKRHEMPEIRALFCKYVHYRYEFEYRIIVRPETQPNDSVRLSYPIGDLFDLIDEVLVSPARKEDVWVSRMIYKYAVGLATNIPRGITTSNSKGGQQFARISQLYGGISHDV